MKQKEINQDIVIKMFDNLMWLIKMGYKALWNSEINYLRCLKSNFVRKLNENALYMMMHNPVANFGQQSLPSTQLSWD